MYIYMYYNIQYML